MFSGSYVTPVDKNYFVELEETRGETAKLKRKEAAITAVAAGLASPGDIKTVLQDSNSVSIQNNGNGKAMNIGIHNLADYNLADYNLAD